MKTIIIGGVAGGASAAARLRRLDEKAEIILLERGEFISFANCGLPYYIGGDIKQQGNLTLQTPQSFKARFNIDVRVFNEALAIDPDQKLVKIVDRRSGLEYTESYDKLILSPGARPAQPKMLATDCDKVFTLRTVEDTKKIEKYVKAVNPKTAVVAGGG
ncbi:MAG: FAD-dependent oxidoreductase, partial [Kiritimatiellae bacterium]|nr:FAD-dependent oxidoreductase [Kiritimatiellia bacterium]